MEEKRIVHRFIQPITAYEENGEFFKHVIPLDVQAYTYYDVTTAFHESGLFYVIGDGEHTYLEIRDGNGVVDYAKEYKVILEQEFDQKVDISDLAPVAISGDYIDLLNKPNIPTKVSDLQNDLMYITNLQLLSALNTKVNIQQGIENVNKILAVNTEGNLTVVDLPLPDLNNLLTTEQLNAVNSTITLEKVNKYDNFEFELNNKLSANAEIKAGTHTKITYDAKGLILSGTTLETTDLPDNIPINKIENLIETLDNKANVGTTLEDYGITNVYNKSEIDLKLKNKADKGTTLADYTISDAYTKTEINDSLKEYYKYKNYYNINVNVNDFYENLSYADYPYTCDIIIDNIKQSYIPTVIFNNEEAMSGNYASVAEAFNGYLRIYAKKIPENNFIIPIISCQLITN